VIEAAPIAAFRWPPLEQGKADGGTRRAATKWRRLALRLAVALLGGQNWGRPGR